MEKADKSKTSGIFYLNWTETYENIEKLYGHEEIYHLMLAQQFLSCNQRDRAKPHIDKLTQHTQVLLGVMLPTISSNVRKYENGCKGGPPCNYDKNIRKMIKKMHEDYHSEELITVLCSWFEHLNKNKKPTKIDNLKETFEEISRQTTSATGAIRIIKNNLEVGNLELDFDLLSDQDYVRLDNGE